MNIYRIWQEANNKYDTYDSAVVIAETMEAAKNMHPSDGKPLKASENDWTSIDNVQCELFGKADPVRTEACIVCASFNAG